MPRLIIAIASILISLFFAGATHAADNDMTFDEFSSTCASTGGTFSYGSGSRTCCWSNWGCLTCVPGNAGWVCTMNCDTQACRNANAVAPGTPPTGPRGLKLPLRLQPTTNAPPSRGPQRTPQMTPAPTQNAPTR